MMEGWLRLMPSWEMQPTYDFLLLLILFIYFLYRLSSKARVAGELEDELIIRLQSLLGNKWSLIAARLPGRTDNEIENYGYILIRASSLNTGSVRQQNSDASNNSISCTSSFSQREIWDPPIGDGGSTYVHVSSNRVTEDEDDDHDGNRDLTAAKEDDDSISEITDFSIWEKGEIIGTGACGTVYVAHNRETRALCAVKELRDVHKPGNGESIKKEIKILSQLEHTNVVKYYGHEIVGCHISLYMEYIQPGSLKKYIWKQRVLPELLIRNFTGQILSGLVYLHSKRVVHRDIKPDNLLVDSNNIIKLVDFGLSKHLEESVGRHSMLGTPYYTAPEVVDKKIEYKSSHEAYAADIWSLGCVIIEMFSGKHPWPGFEPVQVIYKAGKKQHPPIPEKLCPEGNDFLKLCFTRTPADRPSASALLNHPFVKPQITSHTGRRK